MALTLPKLTSRAFSAGSTGPESPASTARTKKHMSYITTKDGTEIFYKDWGSGPIITFSHGWPLSADAWDSQMFHLASNGLPMDVFDGFRSAYLTDRAQFFLNIASGPFFGFNRPGAQVSEGLIRRWWNQGMMCGHKNGYDCIKAFSETDFTDDLKKFDVPTLIIHGEDDQIVPIDTTAKLAVNLLPNAQLKIYPGGSHGLGDTDREKLNTDLLTFARAAW